MPKSKECDCKTMFLDFTNLDFTCNCTKGKK